MQPHSNEEDDRLLLLLLLQCVTCQSVISTGMKYSFSIKSI